MAAHDAGVEVACPRCGQIVLQKAMIPIVGEGGNGVRYLCVACARAVILPPTVPDGVADSDPDSIPDSIPEGIPDGVRPAGTEPASSAT